MYTSRSTRWPTTTNGYSTWGISDGGARSYHNVAQAEEQYHADCARGQRCPDLAIAGGGYTNRANSASCAPAPAAAAGAADAREDAAAQRAGEGSALFARRAGRVRRGVSCPAASSAMHVQGASLFELAPLAPESARVPTSPTCPTCPCDETTDSSPYRVVDSRLAVAPPPTRSQFLLLAGWPAARGTQMTRKPSSLRRSSS